MFSFLKNRASYAFSPLEFRRPGGYLEIWSVAWPLIIMNATSTAMLLLNRGFLAHNQLEDVTAAVTGGQLFFCLNSFFLITTSFTGTIVAQHFGNKDRISCVNTVWNGFYFGLVVGLLLGCLLPVISPYLFRFGNLSDAIREREILYFNALTPSAAFACMEAPFLSFFTATGRSRIVASIKIAVCLFSVPLNYVMIFGVCGFPRMGIFGAGLAASATCLISFLISLSCFLLQNQKEWQSRSHALPSWQAIKKLMVFGMPGGLQVCVRSTGYATVLVFFGYLGDFSLASASLAMTINNIAFFPLLGLMDASSVITGKFIGERRPSIAALISGRAMIMLSCYFVFITILYFAIPEYLIGLFAPAQESGIHYEDVLKMVKRILICQVVQNFFDGLRFVVSGSLRGAGDTRVPLVLSLLTVWLVQVPMAFLLCCIFPCPIWLAWAGSTTLYVVVDAIVIQIRKNTGAWRRIRVIDLPSGENT